MALPYGASLGLAGTVLWLLAAVPSAEPSPSPTSHARALPADTLRAEPAPGYDVSTAYTGEIVARRRSALGFEVAGRVQELLFDEGERVDAGQPLARLDARGIEAQRDRVVASLAAERAVLLELQRGARDETRAATRARVAELEAQLRLADLTLARRQGERVEGVAAQAAVDESVASRDAFAARLRSTRAELQELENGTRPERIAAQEARVAGLAAQLRELELDVEHCTLHAPFAGRIARRYVDEGRVLQRGEHVFELVESGALEAWIGVPHDRTHDLREGDVRELQVGERTLRARIRSLAPDVAPRTRTVTVHFALEGDEHARPGQTARWTLQRTIPERGYWLPASALTKGTRGLWSCFVLVPEPDTGDFVIERRELELLHTSGARSFVRGTLEAGDLVVRSGTHRFVAGQRAVPAQEQ